jgi:hypothetical protein
VDFLRPSTQTLGHQEVKEVEEVTEAKEVEDVKEVKEMKVVEEVKEVKEVEEVKEAEEVMIKISSVRFLAMDWHWFHLARRHSLAYGSSPG